MNSKETTDLERSANAILRNYGICNRKIWGHHRAFVGTSCVVLYAGGLLLVGDRQRGGDMQGRLLVAPSDEEQLPRVILRVASGYEHRENARGHRKGSIRLVEDCGIPVPEVSILMALLSNCGQDRTLALYRFVRSRAALTDRLLEKLSTAVSTIQEEPNSNHPLLDHSSDPALFRILVGEWILTMVEAQRMGDVTAWHAAALRALDARRELEDPNSTTDRARVFSAIKQVARTCWGVPNQALIRESLANDRGPALSKDRIRSVMKTLGFSWIPGKPDWDKDWKPVLQETGWA